MRPWMTGLGEKVHPLLRMLVPVEPPYLLLLQLLLGIFFLLVLILPYVKQTHIEELIVRMKQSEEREVGPRTSGEKIKGRTVVVF